MYKARKTRQILTGEAVAVYWHSGLFRAIDAVLDASLTGGGKAGE